MQAQIFESPVAHQRHNNYTGYWGPPQSSIDWCERNYAVSHYVAEWFNTWSMMLLIALGVFGLYHAFRAKLETRYKFLFCGMISVGVGSAAFHGTLSYIGQQGDELPMIWTLLIYFYCYICLDPRLEAKMPYRAPTIAAAFTSFLLVFSVLHYNYAFVIAFQAMIFGITLAVVRYMYHEIGRCGNKSARWIAHTYVPACGLAFFVWNLDCQLCPHLHTLPFGLPNPQFHAWWHWLTGYGCYVGPVFVVFRRLELLGQEPELRWALRVIPYAYPTRERQALKFD